MCHSLQVLMEMYVQRRCASWGMNCLISNDNGHIYLRQEVLIHFEYHPLFPSIIDCVNKPHRAAQQSAQPAASLLLNCGCILLRPRRLESLGGKLPVERVRKQLELFVELLHYLATILIGYSVSEQFLTTSCHQRFHSSGVTSLS